MLHSIFTLFSIPIAHAAAASATLVNPLQANTIQELIFFVIDLAMNVGVVIAVIMIIYAGFNFIMARGSPTELVKARSFFYGVIIGLAVLIASKVIVQIIQNTLISAQVVKPSVFNLSK